jgi:hypothetical protein
MFKPLTLSVSLAIALGASSMVLAGGHGKVMPAPQGPCPAPPCLPTAQCAPAPCGPLAKCKLISFNWGCLPKLQINHNYTYHWVLKKKRCGPLFTLTKGCAPAPCDSCGPAGVYPTAQYAGGGVAPAPQAYGSGQLGTYGSGQIYGAGQMGGAEMAPPAPVAAPTEGVEAPPVPAGEIPPAPPASASSMLFLPGTGN